VAATSGISAIVAPDGRLVARSREFQQGVLLDRVPLRSAQTWATRLGEWPEAGLGVVALLAALAALVRGRRARQRAEEADSLASAAGETDVRTTTEETV
jgi:apolipoprotein N-acyltransferase